MKKSVFIILLIVTVMTGCKNTEKQEEIKSPKEVVQELETDILSTAWMDDLLLNNDSKWEANLETTEGVEKIQELLKVQITSSIEDYHQLASKLNDVKNNVVKECTMKGASHDNLHVWLLPLMAKIDALSETKTVEDAQKIKQSIIENIDVYSDYFK